MKPLKTHLFLSTSMFALFISGVFFIASCKKESSLDSNTSVEDISSTDSMSAGRLSRNQRPVIKTGPDQTITLPTNSVTVDGSGSYDPDGTIKTFLWTKDFGNGGTIATPNSAKTAITNLTAGVYRFKLTITDNAGASISDTLRVTVKGNTVVPPANQLPVVTVGTVQSITLPVSTVTLTGSASDSDGNIVSYLWTKVSGNGGVITTPNAATTTVTGLTAGAYTFDLKATDNAGASSNKNVSFTVNPATANQSPVVTVGTAQTITLPVSTVTLTGSATDPDGAIASYLWTKVSGTGGVIVTPNVATTTVTGLIAGSYVFNLRATDNAGASSNKNVSVTVNAATPPPPSGYTLTFQSNYDQMSDMLYGGNGQYGNGTISTTTYKTGPGSFYSRPLNVSNGTRSEVQYTEAAQNPIEGAIEYDVMYEVIVPNNGCSIQWHPNTPGSSGSPYLMHDGGKFTWVVWKAGGNTYYPTNFTIQTQKWYHMRMEHKFGTNGYWRHYIDGVLVASWNGNVGDGSGQYLKVGYNGWDANSANSRIYYDNLKIWKK
ncbi:MAG TPA: PKD domain-containing protein [Chitinophagaceae bacterium]